MHSIIRQRQTKPATPKITQASILTTITPRRVLFFLIPLLLIIAVVAVYGSSLRFGFVSDDWPLLELGAHGVGSALKVGGGYHYNPVPSTLVALIYAIVGTNVIPYHLVALILFWIGACLVAAVAWRLTRKFAVAILAGLLFIFYGTQYEAAIWGVVAFWHTISTSIFLGGILCYTLMTDPTIQRGNRIVAYAGFVAAIALSPFAHEQTISLIIVCALYRLLVVEHGLGFRGSQLRLRFRHWLQDFTLPALVLVAYLGLKAWIAQHTPIPQAPGLQAPWNALTFTIAIGMFQATIPGIGLRRLLQLTLVTINPYLHLLVLGIQLIALAIFTRIASPIRRFLALWTTLMVIVMTLGLANISSRHLYLITAPAAILWADLIITLAAVTPRWLQRLGIQKKSARTLRFIPATLLGSALMLAGIGHVTIIQSAWNLSSGHTRTILEQVGQAAQDAPNAQHLYLVDLPDYVDAPTGESLYMFRNAPQAAVRLLYPGRFANVTGVRTRDDFPIARGYTILQTTGQLNLISQQPGSLILRYDARTGNMVHWQEAVNLGGPLTTGEIPSEVPTGELVQGVQFSQSFVSACPRLADIDLYFATYARVNTHPVTIQLIERDSGRILFNQTIDSQTIGDNAWRNFPITPIADSAGKTYLITLTSPESQPGNAVSIWRSKADIYPGGEAAVNSIPINADLVFRYHCNR